MRGTNGRTISGLRYLKQRTVPLFRNFRGEPLGMAATPAEGVFQITDTLNFISNIDGSFLINLRDRSGLKYMIDCGCFRDNVLDFVCRFVCQ
jgi:hypothetical protein